MHEWNEVYTKEYTEEKGEFYSMKPSKTTTWLFEEGTFVPCGKQVGEESFSIQSNYLGTPEAMYDADGKVVWGAELSSYGDVRNLTGERTDCPFRYQGQYEDKETGLYYNRFRYYSVEEGMYICQDPIKLNGGYNLYSYIQDTNFWIDIVGLSPVTFTDSRGLTLTVDGYTNLDHLDVDELESVYYANKNSGHGLSPTDKKGETIVLHHNKQNAAGPITAMPSKYHDKPHTNPGQHPNGKKRGGGLTDTEREAFNKWKKEFWKSQAEKALKQKGVCPK